MKSGPRSELAATTVAVAPGGFESSVTSWYGPWTSVAQPPRNASMDARNSRSCLMTHLLSVVGDRRPPIEDQTRLVQTWSNPPRLVPAVAPEDGLLEGPGNRERRHPLRLRHKHLHRRKGNERGRYGTGCAAVKKIRVY